MYIYINFQWSGNSVVKFDSSNLQTSDLPCKLKQESKLVWKLQPAPIS